MGNVTTELVAWELIPDLAVKLAKLHADEISEQGIEAPIFKKLADAYSDFGITRDPNQMLFHTFPKAPAPLLMMLIGGLTSAGLGYGGATLASKLFPRWDKRKMQRTGTLGGLALGAMPGLLYGLSNSVAGQPFNTNWLNTAKKPYQTPPKPQWKPTTSILPGFQNKADIPAKFDPKNPPPIKLAEDYEAVQKQAGMTGIGMFPPVDVDAFNRVVWKDPYVANRLDPAMRAAATGVVTSAANLPGKPESSWITPLDMGRVAAGMGSGYISGALVGATLGTLMGMPTETQDVLKRTGMYAGIISAIVPKVFGG